MDSATKTLMNAIPTTSLTHYHAGAMIITAMTGNNTQKPAVYANMGTLTVMQTLNATEASNAWAISYAQDLNADAARIMNSGT